MIPNRFAASHSGHGHSAWERVLTADPVLTSPAFAGYRAHYGILSLEGNTSDLGDVEEGDPTGWPPADPGYWAAVEESLTEAGL